MLIKLEYFLTAKSTYNLLKVYMVLFFLSMSTLLYSQKKVIKKFTTSTKAIYIIAEGLDELVLENADSECIEIFLYAENPNKQHIIVNEKNSETEIKFKIPIFKSEAAVFRKYITKRLKRARAIVKIPKNMGLTVFGESINITSKSYHGDLRIFIENGMVRLDTIQQNLELKMYAGNLYGVLKKTNLKIVSKIGKIKIDAVSYQKKYQEIETITSKEVSITTIKGNIFLTHQ
jgi:hypothetical protein